MAFLSSVPIRITGWASSLPFVPITFLMLPVVPDVSVIVNVAPGLTNMPYSPEPFENVRVCPYKSNVVFAEISILEAFGISSESFRLPPDVIMLSKLSDFKSVSVEVSSLLPISSLKMIESE